MNIKKVFYQILALLLLVSLAEAKPRVELIPSGPGYGQIPNVPDAIAFLDANNVKTQIWNKGIFNRDLVGTNSPGFEYPKGSGKYSLFTSGITIAGYVGGALKMVAASFEGEWSPGYAENGAFFTDSRFRLYKVKLGDNAQTNPDYANWGDMVPFGAPYVDENENGQYDAGVDIPGVKDATQTIFICLSDGDQAEHNSSEGFGGGTTPLFAEMHLTAWAYNISGLNDMQFLRFELINKNTVQWDSTHIGVVVDPDLGDALDDWIGCDTLLNMGFVYNADNSDGSGTGNSYGTPPPACGMDYFVSPINRSVSPPDTLGLTSFNTFTNPQSPGATCERDPNSPSEAYSYLKGFKSDGTPVLNPMTTPPTITKFAWPGDPESGNGWTESDGRILNCDGDTTGAVEPSPGGDRRFIFVSGSPQFTIAPGDTQRLVLAQFTAKGSNNLNSVTELKKVDLRAQRLFDADFKVIPPVDQPAVTVHTQEVSPTAGTVNVTLTWQDNAEDYFFIDTLIANIPDSNIYRFEGYEVYEISQELTSLPDFTNPSSINPADMSLLAIYDKQNQFGIIVDTLSMGITIQGNELFAPFPVVPPYNLALPAGFPNGGLRRNITITRTAFPDEHGGSSDLIYGHTYKFVVTGYAVSYGKAPNGLRVIRSPLTAVIEVTPTTPVAGTQFGLAEGDTINNNRRDLGVIPVVKNPELMVNARYRVQFQSPDTTYDILRSTDNGNFYDTLANNLNLNSGARIVDGLEVTVKRIRGDRNNSLTNIGVIKDPTLPRDSVQTRLYGWTYTPEQNRNVEGSKNNRGRVYQSVSQSISWPTINTYTNLRTTVQPEMLRKVEYRFTANGQQAYLFADTSQSNDNSLIFQSMVQVPYTVWEVDATDSTPNPRQLNAAIVVSRDTGIGINTGLNNFEPQTDSLGSKLVAYTFFSDYNPNPDPFYTTKNLFLSNNIDIMYVWAPKAIGPGPTWNEGDIFTIYPYTVTRPFISQGNPLYYEWETPATIIGDPTLASTRADMEKIRVVPNPYYGFSTLQTNSINRFVTFRRLPQACTIKIYTLNGDLIEKLEKDNMESTLQWNLRTFEDVPVASGMYIALIDAPGIGQKIIKLAIFTGEERVDF